MNPSGVQRGTPASDPLFDEGQLQAVNGTGALQATGTLDADPDAAIYGAETSADRQRNHEEVVRARLRIVKFSLLGAVLVTGLTLVGVRQLHGNKTANSTATDASIRYNNTTIPLANIATNSSALQIQNSQTLSINGQLNVNNSVVLSPVGKPTNAIAGQIYFDQTSRELSYYNGSSFVTLRQNTPAPTGVSSIGTVTGAIAVGGGLNLTGNTLSNSGVLTLQGQAGNVTLTGGPGLTVSGTTLSNSGLLSIGGQSGAITLGSGLAISGSQLRNTGVISATGSGMITVTDDGNGNITIDGPSGGSGGGTVSSPGGTAGKLARFSGVQTIANSIISDDGTLVTIGGNLSVTGTVGFSSPLSVANGGTGANSLTTNGVIVGNGTGALSSVAAGAAGQCLVSTLGAPTWVSCPGSGGVSSLNGGNGALTLNNASLSGSSITIQDATTALKGIASFNSTNFTVSSGSVNTIQNINTTAAPTFGQLALTSSQATNPMLLVNNTNGSASGALLDLQQSGVSKFSVTPAGNVTAAGTVTTGGTINGQTISSSASFTGTVAVGSTLSVNTITPNSSLTIGATGQSFLLQGNASSTLTATSGSFKTTVGFQTPTANVTYNFPTATAGSYNICTTAGNCAGVGGGVTTPGGTTGKIAKFTNSGTIGDSILTESGTTITVGGSLSVNTITPSAALTVGATGQNLTLQGATVSLSSTASGTTNSLVFATPSGSGKTITLPNASGTVAVSASGPLSIDSAGNITCPTCLTSGGGGGTSGVSSVNALSGALTLQGTSASSITSAGTTITINDASGTVKGLASFNTTNLTVTSGAVNTVQDIAVTSAPTFAGLTLTTALSVANGGTGANTAANARTNLGAAKSGANSDITSLSGLTTALSVLQGGTGTTSLTAGGVLLGNGTSAISAVTGSNGQCLMVVAGTPAFGTCPGSGGVTTSINGLSGTLTLNNATGTGSTLTIDNAKADGTTKGIAAFNGTNFQDNGSGVINTIQDIATTSAPTFGQLTITSSQAANAMMVINNTNASGTGNLIDLKLNNITKFSVAPSGNTTIAGTLAVNTITPSSSLQVGATSQTFTLQGNGSSTITSTANGHVTTVGFTGGSPTTDPIYKFDSSAATGTYNVCTTASVCTGYAASAGASNYIQNQASSPQSGSFFIQSAANGNISAAIRMKSGQTADLFQIQAVGGSPIFQVAAGTNLATFNDNVLIVGQDTVPAALVVRAGSSTTSQHLILDMHDKNDNTVARFDTVGNLYLGNMNQGISGALYLGQGTTGFAVLDASGITGILRTLHMPNEDGTLCVQNSTNCGFTQLAPSSAQSDSSANASIFINDTGGGNLLQLQTSATNRMILTNAGALQVASVDAITSSGTLAMGGSNAATINIATNSAAHTIAIGTGAAAQSITIGSTNTTSSTTIQGGSGNINLVTNQTGSGSIVKTSTNSTLAFQIQNSSSVSLFTADTSGSIVKVSGTASTFATLVIDNAHFKSSQTTAPVMGTPTNCGTSPSTSITAGSTDSAGSFSITSGTGTPGDCATSITFNQLYGTTPKSIIVVPQAKGGGTGSAAARQIYVDSAGIGGFSVKMNSAPAAGEVDWFYYWIVE